MVVLGKQSLVHKMEEILRPNVLIVTNVTNAEAVAILTAGTEKGALACESTNNKLVFLVGAHTAETITSA